MSLVVNAWSLIICYYVLHISSQLTKEKFAWRLTSVVTVKVFRIIPFARIDFVKDAALLGM